MNIDREKNIRAAIISIPGIGNQRLRQLLAVFGTAQNAWEAGIESFYEWEKAGWGNISWLKDFFLDKEQINPEILRDKLESQGILLVIPEEEKYPFLLAECSDAPQLLFYKGILKPQQECLAVVGARRATPYGKAASCFLAKEIVKSGYVVVSGLARGIDAAAHLGALEAGGETWAFLAGGLDTIYPPENNKLARTIMEEGAVISEYPPGKQVRPGNFPARNRLISGSARGVIVVEAARKSGSLITADFALEQGREVFAVPGPIFSGQSEGTHRLLKMGAKLVAGIEDIISELPPKNPVGRILANDIYSADKIIIENTAWSEILVCLSDIPLHIDRLTMICPLSAQEIALGLLELQLADKIIQLPGQHYVLKRIS